MCWINTSVNCDDDHCDECIFYQSWLDDDREDDDLGLYNDDDDIDYDAFEEFSEDDR